METPLDQRVPIWSVRQGTLRLYYRVFGVLVAAGFGLVIYGSVFNQNGWPAGVFSGFQSLAALAVASAASTIIFIEALNLLRAGHAWFKAFTSNR